VEETLMFKVMVLVTNDETGVQKLYQHEYEHRPTLVGIETENNGLMEALANDYEDWVDLFKADYNLLDSPMAEVLEPVAQELISSTDDPDEGLCQRDIEERDGLPGED
jgi:hypothetical protein